MKINPLNLKYDAMYIGMAQEAAKQAVAEKAKVGCVIVLPSGLTAIGYNGMPPGEDNICEYLLGSGELKTKPWVIHAERNALDKLTRQGVSPLGASVFVTLAPCLSCALSLDAVGVSRVVYVDPYKNTEGLDYLTHRKIGLTQWKPEYE